jgi:two-component system, OmpR family, sensor histidine kinase CiaH
MPGKTKKNQLVFVIYWILLAYCIAALVWWFIALIQQNNKMAALKIEELRTAATFDPGAYQNILEEKKRKTAQYIGEGSIFLLFIIGGAIFVFKAVRNQLKQSQLQQNFMIAITHELKTPIAVAKINLETLQKRKLDEGQQQRLIQNTLQETNRLNALCNNMLLSSQIEAGGYRMTSEELNLGELVSDSITDFRDRYPQRVFEDDISEGVYVKGDQLLLQMIINNLLENAIKYSAKELPIEIALLHSQNRAILQVKDHGPGIPEEEKTKIFHKFYRIGNEATKKAKGTGLGLYLVDRIVETHKGKIEILDNPGGGTIFAVTLAAEA